MRPTWFFAVPRIWEKLMSGLQAFLTSGENAERNRAWLDGGARARSSSSRPARRSRPSSRPRSPRPTPALFAGLRAMLGLDELVAVNVGAAPTPREVLVFFHAIGVPVAELWGMSETCGAGCCNPPDRVKIGTVGPPAPGVEVKLADDGELLVRGAVVMAGYRNQPERTAEALDADGWLHTGDIAEIDEDGYVRIVDRKKEIIINAAGKNMSPANIEATLKGVEPADRPGVRDRRRAPLQHRADRPRLRLRAGLGGPERARGQSLEELAPSRRCWRRCRRASTRPTRTSRGSSRSSASRSCAATGCPAATS